MKVQVDRNKSALFSFTPFELLYYREGKTDFFLFSLLEIQWDVDVYSSLFRITITNRKVSRVDFLWKVVYLNDGSKK